MTDQTPSQEPTGQDRNPEQNGLQQLQDIRINMERGFDLVWQQLADITTQLSTVPIRTVEIFSSQSGFTEGHGGTKSRVSSAIDAVQLSESLAPNEELAKKLKAADAEIQRLRLAETNLRTDIKRLREKEGRFREIILDKAGTQKVSDHEVIIAFSTLRQQVQALVRNPAFNIDKSPNLSVAASEDMKRFYSFWKSSLSAKDLSLRTRGQIFSLLDDYILSRPLFGLDRADTETKETKHYYDIELGLGQFEGLLQAKNVSSGTIADWKICTLECVDLIDLEEVMSKYRARRIYEFLTPLIPSGASTRDTDNLKSEILNICKQAFKLKMMMQRSKEGYRCEKPNSEEAKNICLLSKNGILAEGFAVEAGKDADKSDEISYVLFGALTKHPEYRGEGKNVLEKAQVILKRK